MQLIKMSADKPPESATSEGYYKTENVKVTSGNGEDGKTYIYYQLKLVTNQASLNLPKKKYIYPQRSLVRPAN